MAEEKVAPASPAPVRKFVYTNPATGLPSVYANNVQIAQTVFDLRFVFGEVGFTDKESVEILQRVSVTMSWLEAKVFSEFLASYVRSFEERNGPIQTSFAGGVVNPPPPPIPKVG